MGNESMAYKSKNMSEATALGTLGCGVEYLEGGGGMLCEGGCCVVMPMTCESKRTSCFLELELLDPAS